MSQTPARFSAPRLVRVRPTRQCEARWEVGRFGALVPVEQYARSQITVELSTLVSPYSSRRIPTKYIQKPVIATPQVHVPETHGLDVSTHQC